MNLAKVMEAFLKMEGKDVDPEGTLVKETGYFRADIVPSGVSAIDAAILGVRQYWSNKYQFGRYWIVTVTDSDHGATGLALEASDDTLRATRKRHTGPHTPGFGVVSAADVLRAASGEKTIPRMNTAPFLATESAPGIEWGSVGLVIVKTPATPEFLTALFQLKTQHGFLIAYDATQGAGAYHHSPRADLVAWGAGIHANHTVATLLTSEEVAPCIPALPPSDNFARYTAAYLAQLGPEDIEE